MTNTVLALENNLRIPSPLQYLPILSDKHDLKIWIKRDDLIHPEISGNKWRKLKYNLLAASEKGINHIISFGGAFSNHIYALSAACNHIGMDLTLFVRSYKEDPNNPTLTFARHRGAKLIFLDPKEYRLKENAPAVIDLLEKKPESYLIPEGGSNQLALNGISELTEEINSELEFEPNFIVLSAGTGGSAAGLIKSASRKTSVMIINAVKNPELENHILDLIPADSNNFKIYNNYHRGGFAKSDEELVGYINEFKLDHDICLDPVYTGKMMMAFEDLCSLSSFPSGSSVVLVHTGGLQGVVAHNYIYRKRPEMLIH